MRVTTILGSNSGNKHKVMAEAIDILSTAGKVVMVSSLYETEPWGFESSENFLNQIVVFETSLLPREFLKHCLKTELRLGRVRNPQGPRYTSRPIDIDMLFYDSIILDSPELTIPHPRIAERNFVLIPLQEIMPDFIHPILHKTITELQKECKDKLIVKKINT